MEIPKYDELMKPLLEILVDNKEHKNKNIIESLAQLFNLSQADLEKMLPSGRQAVFNNRIEWAKTYLKKAGLIESPARGVVVITEAGRQVISENPPKIDKKYLMSFDSFRSFIDASKTSYDDDSLSEASHISSFSPDDQLESAYGQINDSLASDLKSEIMKISPFMFEKLVVDLLSHMGYGTLEYGSHTTVKSGDDGIDGIIMEDKLGFSLIYIQAKQWALDRTVGKPEIQGFYGALANKKGDGLFVTTAGYSEKAKKYAKDNHIILIDGDQLVKLMIEYNFCVTTIKSFDIKEVNLNALAKYQEE